MNTPEDFDPAEYQMSWEQYLAAPAGKFYSNSLPAQRELWDLCRETIDRYDGTAEARVNSLGDEVDEFGLVHDTGCMDNGLENLIDYQDLRPEELAELKALRNLWSAALPA